MANLVLAANSWSKDAGARAGPRAWRRSLSRRERALPFKCVERGIESDANTGAKKRRFSSDSSGPPSRTAIVRMKCAEQRLTYEGSSPSGGNDRRTTRPFTTSRDSGLYHEAR